MSEKFTYNCEPGDGGGGGGGVSIHSHGFYGTPETPESLRKRAKQIEKAQKAALRKARKFEAQRKIAIDALERVASDPKRGYASVEAAKALLELPA